MKMKKILSVAAVLAICASLGVSASAASVPASHNDYTDVTGGITNGSVSVEFKKVYDLTNPGTTHPQETLTFIATATGDNTSSAPTVTFGDNGVVTTTKGADTTIPVSITNINAYGVYTYDVAETAASNAPGVDYATGYKLTVSVVYNETDKKVQVAYALRDNDNTKTDNISNTYSAGTLVIESKTTGNLGDKEENFTATVTFSNPVDAEYTENVTWSPDGKTATITYKDDTTITIPNIPYGTTYTVTESDTKGYTFSQNATDDDVPAGATGVIDSVKETDVLTNNKGDDNIDTGLNLDNAPYALALAGVAAVGGTVVIRRRRRVMD